MEEVAGAVTEGKVSGVIEKTSDKVDQIAGKAADLVTPDRD